MEETQGKLTIESVSTLESESVHHAIHLVRIEGGHLCRKLINFFDFSSNSLPFAHSLAFTDLLEAVPNHWRIMLGQKELESVCKGESYTIKSVR